MAEQLNGYEKGDKKRTAVLNGRLQGANHASNILASGWHNDFKVFSASDRYLCSIVATF